MRKNTIRKILAIQKAYETIDLPPPEKICVLCESFFCSPQTIKKAIKSQLNTIKTVENPNQLSIF
jgi:hypothetical protein